MFALQNDAIEQIQLDFLCLLTSLHLILQYLFIWFYSICSFDYPIFVHLILQYLFRSAQYFASPLPSSIWPSMEEKVCAKYNYHLMILIFLWQNSSIHPLTRPLRFLQCWLTSFVGDQVCVGSSAKCFSFLGLALDLLCSVGDSSVVLKMYCLTYLLFLYWSHGSCLYSFVLWLHW